MLQLQPLNDESSTNCSVMTEKIINQLVEVMANTTYLYIYLCAYIYIHIFL